MFYFFPIVSIEQAKRGKVRGIEKERETFWGEIMSLNQSDCVTVAVSSRLPLAEP